MTTDRSNARPPQWAEALLSLPRATSMGALVSSGAFLARTLYDWLVPTTYFGARATVSTSIGFSTLFVVGFWIAWRSQSFIAGPLAAVVTSQLPR